MISSADSINGYEKCIVLIFSHNKKSLLTFLDHMNKGTLCIKVTSPERSDVNTLTCSIPVSVCKEVGLIIISTMLLNSNLMNVFGYTFY